MSANPAGSHRAATVPRRTSTSKATIPQPALDDLEKIVSFYADPDQVEAIAFDLYERIRSETSRVAGHTETRAELYAYQALVRVLTSFAKGREDDTARRIYATIARFNLGDMFRPGGDADRYLIPNELAEE
ncbi:hypothetical protein ACIGW8_22235 [Streptomyces sioyaensis]|uniref:hypothetical protein n=1 Tax=Streptomyces sioyaensis TaxID=67364 RepID=UPI0037D634D2